MERKSGILLPVSSLPSRYGIGCFSREAYEFVDYLVRAGQTYWQILPLGQTGYGDSPYQSFSTFAGNPYFIDPEKLIQLEYISREEADAADCSGDPARVSYADLYDRRHLLLAKAYRNSPFALQLKDRWKSPDYDREREDFNRFIQENIDWLQDYALYWAVKQEMGGIPFIKWERGIRLRFDSPEPGPAIIAGEGARLERVFENLIANALSFSPDQGIVAISLAREQDDVIVRVEDEGPGVPEEAREAIFRRFHSIRPSEESFGRHSGLGLAIARTIVEAHQGCIHA